MLVSRLILHLAVSTGRFWCPELHFGGVQLLGHGQLVDLQVDLANLEDPALG